MSTSGFVAAILNFQIQVTLLLLIIRAITPEFVAYNVGIGAASVLPISVQPKITCTLARLTSFVHYFQFGATVLVIGWVYVYTILYPYHFQEKSQKRFH